MFKRHIVILVILIVAAALRFVGTNPGYNQFHADEGISYSAATSMIKNNDLDPLRYDYPALVPMINYFFFKLFFIPLFWLKYFLLHINQLLDGTIHIPIAPLEAKRIFQLFILGERERNAIFWGRYVTALFSLGNVFLTYLLGKKLFGKKVGLLAATLLAFNFKHVVNSHIGLPDIYNSFFLLLSFLAAHRLWQKPTKTSYFLAAIAAGLSFSVKYQVFAFLPIGLAHFYVSIERVRLNFRKLFSPEIFLFLLTLVLVILVINPYHLAFLDRTLEVIKGVSLKYGMGTKKLNLYPFSYFYHIDYGAVESILILIGIFVSTVHYFKKTILFWIYLIPYGFVFFYYSIGGFYIRNFITITPILLIMAAVGLGAAHEFILRKTNKFISRIAIILILGLAVFVPGRNAVINSYYYTKPLGYDKLRAWAENNLSKDIAIAAHPFDYQRGNLKGKRSEFEISGNYSLAEHRDAGATYALMNLDWAGNPFYFWMNFGFDQVRPNWGKPLAIMRNTFHGIAAEELFRYQIFSYTKPWQAPDSGIVVSKLPVWPKKTFKIVQEFTFTSGLDDWMVQPNGNEDLKLFGFDGDEGKAKPGSVVFAPGGVQYPGFRISSPPISVKPGHLYKVTGSLRTESVLTGRERDGYLRVDFYKDRGRMEDVGIVTTLSSRVFGTNNWAEKEIVERAPDGSQFLTVSFGIYDALRTRIWLDDLIVEESLDLTEDITASPPYVRNVIDLNLLYPNSHGNL